DQPDLADPLPCSQALRPEAVANGSGIGIAVFGNDDAGNAMLGLVIEKTFQGPREKVMPIAGRRDDRDVFLLLSSHAVLMRRR
ncbi:MAG: hypothetical protein V4601_11665, partial [Pseudomonadota bacterium]